MPQFPRTLDTRFRSLTPQQLEQFAREDPKIRRHLDVVRRKDLLEHVLKEMEALRALEQREKRNFSRGRGQLRDRDSDDRRKKSWSLF